VFRYEVADSNQKTLFTNKKEAFLFSEACTFENLKASQLIWVLTTILNCSTEHFNDETLFLLVNVHSPLLISLKSSN
jgi:hypothetical protein